MIRLLQLAQRLPDTEDLKSGDAQTILVWIIGFLVFLLFTVTGYLLKTISDRKKDAEKRDEEREKWDVWKEKAHNKMMKLALRVQKGIEAWAGIQADMTEEDEE